MGCRVLSMRYLILIEKAANNYSAYAPDVPGCIATGKTAEETREKMVEALKLHFDGLHADGDPIPKVESESSYVEFDWTPSPVQESEGSAPLYGLRKDPREELHALVDRLPESQVPIVGAFLEFILERSKAEGDGRRASFGRGAA